MKCDEKLDKPRKVFYIPHIEEDVKKKETVYNIITNSGKGLERITHGRGINVHSYTYAGYMPIVLLILSCLNLYPS